MRDAETHQGQAVGSHSTAVSRWCSWCGLLDRLVPTRIWRTSFRRPSIRSWSRSGSRRAGRWRWGRGQVIFCQGEVDSADDGCVDLVVDVEATPDWHITDVRYWGFPSDRWHLDFDRGARLADQLAGLAQILPSELD